MMRVPTFVDSIDGVLVTPFEDFAARILLNTDIPDLYYCVYPGTSFLMRAAVIRTIRECRENNDNKYDFIKRMYCDTIFKYYMKLKKKWFYTKLPQIPFHNGILFKECVKLYA